MNPLPESDKGFARNITLKEKSDIRTLMRFVEIYCREKQHQEKSQFTFKVLDIKSIREKDLMLCPECSNTALPCDSSALMIQSLCARSAQRNVIRENTSQKLEE
jgi:hypothetical protein